MSASAVVTGGSLGIGADVCQRFLDNGLDVINLSNQEPKIAHQRLTTISIDLTDRDATRKAAKEIAAGSQVTRFVHCAGTVRPAVLDEVELDDLDYLTELHINSAVTLTQAFAPAMRSSGFGRIVLISTRGILGLKTRTSYAATKAAMLGLVRTWALELAEFGVTVNAIAPGPIETEMFLEHLPDAEVRRQLASNVPVQRLGAPGDIGRVVEFLAAKDSGFITGQTLYVCGGASLGVLTM